METEQNCNILTPTLLAIIAFLSRSPGLLNQVPGGPASLGHVSHSSIFSPTATAQSGAWGPTLLGAGFLYCILSPTHLISNWLTSCLHPGYIIIWRPLFFLRASQFRTHSTRSWSRLYSDIPRPDVPVIYTGAFTILTAWPGRRSIYNTNKIGSVSFWITLWWVQ